MILILSYKVKNKNKDTIEVARAANIAKNKGLPSSWYVLKYITIEIIQIIE